MKKREDLFNRIKKLTSKDLGLIDTLRFFNLFILIGKNGNISPMKILVREYFGMTSDLPDDFYEAIIYQIRNNRSIEVFSVFAKRNIYLLISYLKYNQEDIIFLEEILTPLQYYQIPKKHINRIMAALEELSKSRDNDYLREIVKDELLWLLKREPNYSDTEIKKIAYKIYLSIGLDNGLELLGKKYGEIDYEIVYFLFSGLNYKEEKDSIEGQAFRSFLFENKKDNGNVVRQMLNGKFNELFLNFDYFYNNFSYFVSKLGIGMTKEKVRVLLKERYLASNIALPEITGDVLNDMISSYHSKAEFWDVSEEDIHSKNFETYNEYLRNKYKSSIPMIKLGDKGSFSCELVALSDPRNLVLGYRSGNCFRINGDASILFRGFLQSEHMRILSISTLENKDFAMMLIMRNGNVLIGQGIEVSKRVSQNFSGKELYDVCREALRELMDYMNSMGDEIVATIIGRSNGYVANYNNQVLPFLVSPILKNSDNYYNGIANYQCLLDIREGSSLHDIKLFVPKIRYLDERAPILRRERHVYSDDNNYMDIEKRLIALRYLRMQKDQELSFYRNLTERIELYTSCNRDWYITLFEDGTIDSFLAGNDERAKSEYDEELERIQKMMPSSKKKKIVALKYKSKKL